jgi:hypothetical protein
MANETFDSGKPHVVLPVANTSGGVDRIAVPADTEISDLHNSLSAAGYEHPSIDEHLAGPTKEGSLEYSAPFRKVAASAWSTSGGGTLRGEAGTYLDAEGQPSKVQWQPEGDSQAKMQMSVPRSAPYLIHTHPNDRGSKPSPADIRSAKEKHKTIYVTSKAGLFAVDPAGKVSQVFKSPSWASDKNPK